MKFEDVHGEYLRKCPYCQEFFTADHMNRKFCPTKNGRNNFCKNRWKRLKLTNDKKSNQNIEILNAQIVKTVINADDLPQTTTSLKYMAEMRRRNEYILLKELNNRKSCLADLYKLEKKGLDLKYYYQKEILKTTDKTMTFGSVKIEFLENPKFVRIRDKTKE